jgi:hypothetical protein
LNVITEHLTVTLRAALSETLTAFTSARHVEWIRLTVLRYAAMDATDARLERRVERGGVDASISES